MPRPSKHVFSRLAKVRRYYGLHQRELAALLGVSPELVKHIEAGRRALAREVSERLAPFAQQMGETEEVTDSLVPPAGPFDPAPLRARRSACLHEAANLRWQLRPLAAQAQVVAHWAAARPGLLAALPPAPDEPLTPEAVRLRYVHARLALAPDALPSAEVSRWHLLRLRAEALETEAAALAALLASAEPGL